MPELATYAVDFESYYDAEVSIKTLGAYMYLRHPQTDIYMVAIFGDDVDYVGPPDKAPWEKIAGALWISHNAAFDGLVFERLVELGVCQEEHRPSDWQCTANMAVYLAAPRNLSGAVYTLLGAKITKAMRNYMKGKTWGDAIADGKDDELCNYARDDARWCRRLWMEWSPKWPAQERALGQITTKMAWGGVYLDVGRIEAAIQHLKDQIFTAREIVPWGKLDSVTGQEAEPLFSPIQLAIWCDKWGIPAPRSVAQDSEECEEWLDTFKEYCPWVDALRTCRRCNSLLRKLETMLIRLQPNGRMGYGLKYFGAHTGRWSGDAGWNAQNLQKEETFGVDLRACIIPEPGKKFIIADLSQIEARILAHLAGDKVFLALCETMSPYDAHARTTMRYEGENLKQEDPKTYALAKARVLALGFQAGWLKFITMAKKYGVSACFDEPVTAEQLKTFENWLVRVGNKEWLILWKVADSDQRRIYTNSWLIVSDYRASNPAVTELWEDLFDFFKAGYTAGRFTLTLPSGRSLFYRQISNAGGQWTAQVERFGPRVHFYGGKLAENAAQATARDVFAERLLDLDRAGHRVVLPVHDEWVIECPLSTTCAEIEAIVSQPIAWLPGCPIACEAHEAMKYEK